MSYIGLELGALVYSSGWRHSWERNGKMVKDQTQLQL